MTLVLLLRHSTKNRPKRSSLEANWIQFSFTMPMSQIQNYVRLIQPCFNVNLALMFRIATQALFNKYFIFATVICHFHIILNVAELVCCGEPLWLRKLCDAYRGIAWPLPACNPGHYVNLDHFYFFFVCLILADKWFIVAIALASVCGALMLLLCIFCIFFCRVR